MKATKSRDGKKRFNLRIVVRLGLDEIALAMLHHVAQADPDDIATASRMLAKFTRPRALKAIRQGVQSRGDEGYSFQAGDEVRDYIRSQSDRDTLFALADKRAAELFPELV